MATLATALTNLAALSVTGVTHNYAITAIPESVSRGSLPALIVSPAASESIRDRFGSYETETVSGSNALLTYIVTHFLLYVPIGSRIGARDVYSGLVTLVDNYAIAVKANPKLTDALFYPTRYQIHISPFKYGGVRYYGARFYHKFVVEN